MNYECIWLLVWVGSILTAGVITVAILAVGEYRKREKKKKEKAMAVTDKQDHIIVSGSNPDDDAPVVVRFVFDRATDPDTGESKATNLRIDPHVLMSRDDRGYYYSNPNGTGKLYVDDVCLALETAAKENEASRKTGETPTTEAGHE